MTTITSTSIIITIPDNEPKERLSWLIKAIAACIRWRAQCSDPKNEDRENMVVLSDLLAELADARE